MATIRLLPRHRRFWKKWRFWTAVALLALFTGTVTTAVHRGRQTRIIFINAGSETLPPLRVSALGRTHRIPALETAASHRWVGPAGGVAGPVVIVPETLGNPPWKWEGGLLHPDRGARLILRFWADGTVEECHAPSFWCALLGI